MKYTKIFDTSKLNFQNVSKISFFFFFCYQRRVCIYTHILKKSLRIQKSNIKTKQLSHTFFRLFFRSFEKKVFCLFSEYKIVQVTYDPVHSGRFSWNHYGEGLF